MKKRIVFITDCADVAYNELRGVILDNIKSDEIIIEPIVLVTPFSIINGNFVLRLMADAYPESTIFSVILNPSKERPARLIGKTKKKGIYFMGANTGVFTWLFRDFGIEELYELNDPGFFPFGGKYVHAPAVAQIATGKPLKDMGHPFDIEKVVKIDIAGGAIVHIDNFGLMKFTGELRGLKEGDKLGVNINGKILKAVYAERMMSRETGEWVIYPGSSLGLPELGRVRENGAKDLNAKVGDIITFKKI
ncbi:MAG: SAM-dependent chlorinase/fluorinase [Candidatus Paceibacterota bacterium]|nr:SAM-dependent chlorinase/fluorinase [Candidatus Paceibacterota bacterium]MDD4467036.1 SAM-dependent chlorinase/fluorinase [Candidatus Paceibacterota bacterium]MDD4897263.1 SAM-dependent chlorinase/fluorinase [Candidatus Paceibacterota bacterium]